jgi:hypothetical protein
MVFCECCPTHLKYLNDFIPADTCHFKNTGNIWEGNNKYSNLLVSCTPWASNSTEKLYYVVVVYKNIGKNI